MREGRVALVTGAARGVGRAIALRLAEDGLDVAVNDLPGSENDLAGVVASVERLGRRYVALPADVCDPDSVAKLLDGAVAALGRLDVLVANAGIAVTGPLLDLTPSEWERVMAVNVYGVHLCYCAAARVMIAQGTGGKIIGAGSVAGYRAGKLQGVYSASKFAVRGLTQAAAQEWAEYGITVNAYCPGVVDTAMWEGIDEALTQRNNSAKGSAMRAMTAQIALNRIEQPADVAGLVSFLASPDSDYVTGQSLVVDGGIYFS